MTSNLDCLGLGVADEAELFRLAEDAVAAGAAVHVADGVTTHRWTDPCGARLSLGIADDALLDLLPSYAGTASTRLAGISRIGDEGLVGADVVDIDGEVLTRLACDLEQWRALPPVADPAGAAGTASVTAFGLEMTSQPDPAHLPDEFVSFGIADPANGPHARVSGLVSEARTLTVAVTGRSFHSVRLDLGDLGLRLDVCLPVSDWPIAPAPGSVLAGTVYLVASLDALWESRSRTRGFGRRS